MRRPLASAGLFLMWVVLTASPALADPPGPTDYQSEVVEIEPAVAGIEVEVVGGDSFFLLTVEPGLTVEVAGYRGEPYLRFLPAGTVEENQNAPSKYTNEDRFGRSELPDGVDATASPDWRVVSSDGSFAWHDHRTHWMSTEPKPGSARGDVILEAVVPLVVDGTEVLVHVRSTWVHPPSRWPPLSGAAIGVLVVAGASRLGRRHLGWIAALWALAAAALAIGVAQVASLPPETGPSPTLWALPAAAIGLSALSFALSSPGLRVAMVVLGCVPLAWWSLTRFDGLTRPILPTDAPFGLDRFVTAAALSGAAAAAVVGLWRLAQAVTSEPVVASVNFDGR